MIKTFTTFLCFFLLLSSPLLAQLPDGSIGPDFTVTDLDGNEHNLYEVLAEGKTVVVDFFATWCPPCWAFHQDEVLKDIYNEYGPNGTDEIYVYAIESDRGTNLDCLYGQTGCNDVSLGDWTAGVPYPIIDDRDPWGDYQNSAYPTITMIYPDRTVAQLRVRSVQGVLDLYNAGPQLTAGVNTSFLELEVPKSSVCRSVDASAKYSINNIGEETITSADIIVSMNGENIFEEQWQGEVSSWGIVKELIFDDISISENSILEMRMDNINGDPANSISNTTQVLTDVTNRVTINITTDGNAAIDGNKFNIINLFGQTIASETLDLPFHDYSFTYDFEELNCYAMTLSDSGGDGIDGLVEVKDNLNRIIFNNADFGGSEEIVFNASQNSNTNDVLSAVTMTMSPNPVSNMLYVNMDLESSMSLNMSITSIDGRVIRNEDFSNINQGQQIVTLDLQDLEAGLYFINLTDGKGNLTKKFIKE